MLSSKIALPCFALLALLSSGCGNGSDNNNPQSSSSSQSSVSSLSISSVEQASSSSEAVSSAMSSVSSLPEAASSSMSSAAAAAQALITDDARPVIDASALVRANTAFNADMFKALDKSGKNLFISSFSVFSALSMTYAGAKNATAAEFEHVLHYDANLSVHESFAQLLGIGEPQQNIFRIANSLWPQEGYPFKEDFIYTVQSGYFSEVNFQDYINRHEDARLSINDWVEQKTENKIVDLIPTRGLDSSTRLVLVNALYFKGAWKYEFDANATDEQPFHLSDGTETTAQMMHIEGELYYGNFGNFKLLKLPYKEEEFSMLIALPDTNEDMSSMQSQLFDLYSVSDYVTTFHPTVIATLPKFKIKWGTESLTNMLMELGMIETFNGNLADFTGMWYRQGDENLYIKNVFHQTFIEVNEEGAEAAAATAVVVGETSASPVPVEPIVFNADHPFLFFIIDERSGMIVFSGKVEDPTL